MHIETLGDGPDLVMIHGWAMHSGIFAPLTRALQKDFRLHLVDLPGHGASRVCDLPCDPELCANELLECLPPALWLGWSLGGLVSLHAALAGPARVRGLVQIAATPCFVARDDWPHGMPGEMLSEFAAGLQRNYRATIVRFLALEALGSEHAESELRELKAHVFERGEPEPEALRRGLQALEETDMRKRITELAMPSLWIAGRRDRLVPAAAMRWAAQANARASFAALSSGHAPFIGYAAQIREAVIAMQHELAA